MTVQSEMFFTPASIWQHFWHSFNQTTVFRRSHRQSERGSALLNISFYGVRGSTPCSCESTRGIGGNTACVVVEPSGEDPIVLDLGTGLRYYGQHLQANGANPFVGTALVTHLHWDHVQGIPFFKPLLHPDSKVRIIGPPQVGSTLAEEIESFVKPPLFPVELSVLPGTVEFVESASGDSSECGSCTITTASVPHCGSTNGYRIQNSIGSVAYISDHQQPADGSLDVPAEVVELCRNVDVLIHDAQYSAEEFETRKDWGHSTPEYALEVARVAGVKRLVLFHHDPAHSDDWVRATEKRIADEGARHGIEVIAAYEGLQLTSG